MRKLLSSKLKEFENSDQCLNPHKRTITNYPKRTLLSNWNVRNDSSNVCALLHPEDYLQTPRKYLGNSQRKQKSKSADAVKKCCLSTNTCYCRESRIKPKLLSRPRQCLTLEDFGNNKDRSNLIRTSFRNCLCAGTSDLSEPESIGVYQEDNNEKDSMLHLTEQRKDYNIFRTDENDRLLNELAEYDEGEQQKSISTLLGTRHGQSSNDSSNYISEEHLDIEDMRNFRDEHYFETHAAGDFERDIPEHTCIHQFKLDERLLAHPINVDVYGRSRCTICSKPMKGEKVQLSKTYFTDKNSKVSLKNFAKCYQLGLIPRTISIGGDKSKIELKLNKDDLKKFGCFIGRYKRPQYTNTFALRQQKMC